MGGELWSEPRQITHLNGKVASRIYLLDNNHILFSCKGCGELDQNNNSNSTDLYEINEDGTGLKQVTFSNNGFDAYPAINNDGSFLLWSSNNCCAYECITRQYAWPVL
ncbi:WD40-like protein [Ditylenchus destructor]|uniref:WD40-like protein n=1 Tax=Ditylenchus destructor TaxID=166010 RepID=A0AAD4MRK2_9BILA|nr:WD40-like protein [Ditylenchus destructor]